MPHATRNNLVPLPVVSLHAQIKETLPELPDVFDKMLAGGSFGRTLVRLTT